MNRLQIGLAGVFLGGLGWLLVPAGEVAAGPKNPQQAQANQVKKQAHHQLVQALHALEATRRTLLKADHDYGGHRVAAVRSLGAAEQQLKKALHAHHHARGNKNGKAGKNVKGTKGKGQPETQAVSDMQLAQAIPILQKAAAFLKNAGHDFGGHRAHAVRDLNQAVKQLQLALKFEQNRQQKKNQKST